MQKIITLIIPILLLGIFLISPNFVIGQDEDGINQEVKELSNEINSKRKEIEKIQEQQEEYSNAIKQKQSEKASLNNQIAILENRIAKHELDIETVELEIDQTNLEIKRVNLEIETKNLEIDNEKEKMAKVLRLLYKQEQVDTLEIMLLNNSLVEFLNGLKYLEDMNSELTVSLDKLFYIKEELEVDKLSLNDKNKELLDLKDDLNEKTELLKNDQGAKIFVLEQVREDEREYERLLNLAREEQNKAAADIASLEKAVRTKIANLSGKTLEFNDNGLIWPVPKNVITAYFHDPEYPFRYIFEHPAIDIRAGQGTTIKAAASGYVARTKFSGKDYAYIMIVHGDGLSTVYGHVSKIFVSEDEFVIQGQSIGASGGLPGTNGAGRLTTGPHLHFEVRLDGIPVNPLEYLP